MRKSFVILLVIILTIVIFSLIGRFTKTYTIGGTCDFQGGWGRGTPSSCDCVGKKIVIDNSLPVDGNYHTICIGIGFYTDNSL